jgi:hypothetical protein
MLIFAAAYDWHPGKPMLVFWVNMTFLIVGGLWLWDEIREMLAEAPSPKPPPACSNSRCMDTVSCAVRQRRLAHHTRATWAVRAFSSKMHQLAASAIGPLLCALDPGRILDRMTKKAREANPITRRKPAYFEVRLSQKADQLQDQLSRLGGEIGSKTRRGRSSLKGRRVAIKYRDKSGNTRIWQWSAIPASCLRGPFLVSRF